MGKGATPQTSQNSPRTGSAHASAFHDGEINKCYIGDDQGEVEEEVSLEDQAKE